MAPWYGLSLVKEFNKFTNQTSYLKFQALKTSNDKHFTWKMKQEQW